MRKRVDMGFVQKQMKKGFDYGAKVKNAFVNAHKDDNNTIDSKERQKFINSKAWKDFRQQCFDEKNGMCEFCGRKIKGKNTIFNLHHRSMDKTEYDKIENPEDFAVLCANCHSQIHNIYSIVCTEQSIGQRVKEALNYFFMR